MSLRRIISLLTVTLTPHLLGPKDHSWCLHWVREGHDPAAGHPLNQGVSQLANSPTTVDSERVATAIVVTGSLLYSFLSSYCFERTVAILLYVELACG